MPARVIAGEEIARKRRAVLSQTIAALKERGIQPGLAAVLVGEDPASMIYVRNKIKACKALGINSFYFHLSEKTEEKELLDCVHELNLNPSVHAILVQLPLPRHIDENKIMRAIAPLKDADGFHPFNLGQLLQRKVQDLNSTNLLLPCTPAGCMVLLKETGVHLEGKLVAMVGDSTIVGKPMALLLLAAKATVTICHKHTKNLAEITKQADILITAIGCPKLIKAEMVKKGAVVLDIGISRVQGKLCGDVDFDQVKEVASFITPVPGGVGPMTVQMLLENTVRACVLQKGEGKTLNFPFALELD